MTAQTSMQNDIFAGESGSSQIEGKRLQAEIHWVTCLDPYFLLASSLAFLCCLLVHSATVRGGRREGRRQRDHFVFLCDLNLFPGTGDGFGWSDGMGWLVG